MFGKKKEKYSSLRIIKKESVQLEYVYIHATRVKIFMWAVLRDGLNTNYKQIVCKLGNDPTRLVCMALVASRDSSSYS